MKKRWILVSVLAVLFLVILVSILMGRNLFIDNILIDFIFRFRNDTNTNILKILTLFGEKYVVLGIVIIIAGILFLAKYRKDSYMFLLNLFNIVVLNKGIKYLVRRDRPISTNWLVEEDGFSFPSGHSMLSIGVYGFLIFLIYKSNLKLLYKRILITILSIIILIVGISRIYLGVHYPSDVLGGYIITTIYLVVFITVINVKVYKRSWKISKKWYDILN